MTPKTYCLTCSQLPWKTETARARFEAAGLAVEFYDGVHGATVGITSTLCHLDSPGFFNSPGKISITVSKLLLFQMLLERPDDPVLVLENDVTLCPDFAGELAKAMAALPADWEVVHVGHCCAADKPTTRVNDRVSEVRYPFCCHGILWTKRALRVASEELKKASWGTPSDIILARTAYPRLRHYSFVPPLVWQDETQSEAASTGRWDSIDGWFDFARLYDEALDGAQARGRPSTFVEVGAWKGRSTAYLAEEIKRRILPVTLYAVDTWKGMPFGGLDREVAERYGGDLFPTFLRNMSRAGVLDYVRPVQKPSTAAAADFPDGSVDFVFVDGDHTYAAVAADIDAWRPKLAPGGVLAGHDFPIPDVARAVRDRFPGRFRTWEQCWIVD